MEATSTTGNSNSANSSSKTPLVSSEANGAASGALIPNVSNASTEIPESAKSVLLNVGGRKYEVLRKNLTNFPGSRLWKLVHANTKEEILRVCDRFKPGIDSEADFVPAEYFFDHNFTGFAEILDAYRSGRLHLCLAGNCAYTTREDIAYWGIDELLVEPCCAVKYYSEIEICIKELDTEEEEKQREIEREKVEDFGPTWYGKLRKKLWNLFEYPQTSKGAKFIACWSLSMVVISTACFVLSCVWEEDLEKYQEIGDSTHPDIKGGDDLLGFTSTLKSTTTASPEEGSGNTADSEDDNYWNVVYEAIVWIDAFTAVYFTIEYVIRFVCAPEKIKFFIQPLNLVDLFAILPYIFSFVLDHLSEFHIIGKAGKVVRLVRVTRILRVFKLVRHFAGLQSLFATLKQAHRELGLLVMLVGVSVLTFSSLVYFSEKDEQNWTFLDSFWWGLLTITTVGYGTSTPISGFGKFIGGICALFGVFTITLPVPIVVNSFSNFYKTRLWRSEVALKRRERLIHTTGNNTSKESAHIELNGVQ